ncbi:hypothetical protein KEM52_006735 [Ascosphaera acerosa]|nr:hypothetical protein KEM52_006735 [Ascosphaera acerosa]
MLLMLPLHLLLVAVRLPLLAGALAAYFLVLQWLPIGPLGKKACLWSILGIPGIWWIDLQIDGVRKGRADTYMLPSLSRSLGKQTATRLPQAGSVIASSFTSPIDALYLAAIFDPVFTVSYPSTQEVRQISLLEAILRAFARPEIHPHTRPHHLSSLFTSLGSLLFFIFSLLPSELAWLPPRPSTPPPPQLVTLEQLLQRYPDRAIAVFPECTPTNGNGILRLSPSLVGAGASRPIYPVSLRYTPADITTPVPDSYVSFLWHLLRKPTHCIRVRIAEQIVVPPAASAITAGGGVGAGGTEPSLRPFPGELGSVARRQQLLLEPKLCLDIQGNTADVLKVVNGAEQAPSLHPLLQRRCGERGVGRDSSVEAQLNSAQRELLNQVSDSLARLARVRRVALGAREKIAFVDAFARNGGRMVA